MATEQIRQIPWLEAQQPYTVTGGGDSMIVEHKSDEFDAVINRPPPVSTLTIMCRKRLDLRATSDAEYLKGFTVHLVADEFTPALCRLRTRQAAIKCSTRLSTVPRARHQLAVESPSGIEITGGDWHIDAIPSAEPKPNIWLSVDNTASSLHISSDIPVLHLESRGSHEYDLRNPPEMAQIVTAEGTATLRQPLHSAEATGLGSLRVLGSVTDSHINLHGDLEVHGNVGNAEVLIGGDLEALGSVTLGEQGLECRNALIRGDLTAASPIECESLDVAGTLETGSSVKLQKLRCSGALKVAQLEVAAETIITGGARHTRRSRGASASKGSRPRRTRKD